MNTPRIAMLHTRIRVEERLLLEAFDRLGVDVEPIDLRRARFETGDPSRWRRFDAVLDRSLSLSDSVAALRVIETFGVRTINRADAVERCADKLRTTFLLAAAGVPTPHTEIALSADAAIEAVERVGYPAVLKPTTGSWGRLVSRVNDRDAAEAVIEHRETLGGPHYGVFYVQEHIAKPGRDLRLFVVGGRTIAAIARSSEHWLTNTARGAEAEGFASPPEFSEIAERAVAVTGADIAAVDILEDPARGPLVCEINHSMEFRNSIETTGVDIPARIASHAANIAAEEHDRHAVVVPRDRTAVRLAP